MDYRVPFDRRMELYARWDFYRNHPYTPDAQRHVDLSGMLRYQCVSIDSADGQSRLVAGLYHTDVDSRGDARLVLAPYQLLDSLGVTTDPISKKCCLNK